MEFWQKMRLWEEGSSRGDKVPLNWLIAVLRDDFLRSGKHFEGIWGEVHARKYKGAERWCAVILWAGQSSIIINTRDYYWLAGRDPPLKLMAYKGHAFIGLENDFHVTFERWGSFVLMSSCVCECAGRCMSPASHYYVCVGCGAASVGFSARWESDCTSYMWGNPQEECWRGLVKGSKMFF